MTETLTTTDDQLINLVNHSSWPFAPVETGSYSYDSYGMRWTKRCGLMVPDLMDSPTVGTMQGWLVKRGYIRSIDFTRDGVKVFSTSGRQYIEPTLGEALVEIMSRALNGSIV